LALALLGLAGFQSISARAQVVLIFPERQAERKSSRWTLGDWLVTKRKIDAQNFWLAQHTNKVPLDLTYGLDVSPGRVGHELDFYILWFGLRARFEQGQGLWPRENSSLLGARDKTGEAAVQLRLFGGNIQNTNLILRGAYEYADLRQLGDALNGAYGVYGLGPELQIYFAQWLGVRGDWRKRVGGKRITARGAKISGESYSLLAFLEMGSLRLESGWVQRQWILREEAAGGQVISQDSGHYVARLRAFF
jgi:hypothetical protein